MCDIDEKNYDEKKLFPSILAVDFDGTLVENQFPGIGKFNSDVVEAVMTYKMLGWKVILWSCRTGTMLEDAVKACAQIDLTFDAVNDNLPEVKSYFGENTRKVFANLYWDDRNAVLCIDNDDGRELIASPLILRENTVLSVDVDYGT